MITSAKSEPVDEVAAQELFLSTVNENDDTFRSRVEAIMLNLARKKKKGTYDPELATKLWLYAVEDEARIYDKEFGSGRGSMTMFNRPTRIRAAEKVRDYWDENVDWKVEELDKIKSAYIRSSMSINWESNNYDDYDGTKKLVLITDDEGEICNFAMAMSRVLSEICGYDEDELEQEWFNYSCGGFGGEPSASGAEKWFNKHADEVLESLSGLEQSAWDIFDYVRVKSKSNPDYGSGDDRYASALFPTD